MRPGVLLLGIVAILPSPASAQYASEWHEWHGQEWNSGPGWSPPAEPALGYHYGSGYPAAGYYYPDHGYGYPYDPQPHPYGYSAGFSDGFAAGYDHGFTGGLNSGFGGASAAGPYGGYYGYGYGAYSYPYPYHGY